MPEPVLDLAPVDEIEADEGMDGGQLVGRPRDLEGSPKIVGGRRAAAGQRLDVAELAKACGGDLGVALRACKLGASPQQDRAFVVEAADGMDQPLAELQGGHGQQMAVGSLLRLGNGMAEVLDAGIGGAGRQCRQTRSHERPDMRLRRHAGGRRDHRAPRRAAQCGRGPDAKLILEQSLGGLDMGECGIDIARRGKTPDQQHVGAFVVDVAPNGEFGQPQRACPIVDCQGAHDLAADPAVYGRTDACPLGQQPDREFRAALRLHPFEQIARLADIERIQLELPEVDLGAGWKPRLDRIADQAIRRVQRLAQRSEAPAHGTQWIDAFREQLGGELLPAERTRGRGRCAPAAPRPDGRARAGSGLHRRRWPEFPAAGLASAFHHAPRRALDETWDRRANGSCDVQRRVQRPTRNLSAFDQG